VAQPPVINNSFSTEFQLNDDAVEGKYTIKIGAKELTAPVDFAFIVSKAGGSNSGGGSSSGGGAFPAAEAVTSTTGSAAVIPSAGGTIGLGSEVTIILPAGALTGSGAVEIKVKKVTTPPAAPTGFRLAGGVYEFSVGGKDSYSFARSVTIKLSFGPSVIGADEVPVIQYYDQNQEQWVNLGGDISGDIMTAQVNHFTKFTVMAAKKTEAQDTLFIKDIVGHWAFNSIKKLVALGAANGYPDGSFKPNNNITRAEFAAMLVKAFKLENKAGKTFADTMSHWAKDSIATAAANGMVNGYDASSFGPDDLITREQMAVMVVNAAKLPPAPGETRFADSGGISGWAREAMATATGSGIIKGYPDNTIRPKNSATRGEAVTVIVNALSQK
jgi:hypothetical protein